MKLSVRMHAILSDIAQRDLRIMYDGDSATVRVGNGDYYRFPRPTMEAMIKNGYVRTVDGSMVSLPGNNFYEITPKGRAAIALPDEVAPQPKQNYRIVDGCGHTYVTDDLHSDRICPVCSVMTPKEVYDALRRLNRFRRLAIQIVHDHTTQAEITYDDGWHELFNFYQDLAKFLLDEEKEKEDGGDNGD